MLAQLRDDLAELIDGLESRSLPYDVVVAGARTQLQWVLNELNPQSPRHAAQRKSDK